MVPLAADIAPENVPVVNVPAVPVKPFGKLGAPFAFLFVILSTRIRPLPPAPSPPPSVPRPRISGITSSPSSIIKSAPSSNLISAYCVYAPVHVAG